MGELAVLVNGLPGAGKTTLCSALRSSLDMPVVAKDAIKEALAEAVDVRLPTRDLGALSSDAMWSLIAWIDVPVIIESFWMTGRDEEFLRAGLERAGVRRGVEVWCEAPLAVMRTRFTTRPRHFAHRDADRVEEWESLAAGAEPMSGYPVIRVDTSRPVDIDSLAAQIRHTIAH